MDFFGQAHAKIGYKYKLYTNKQQYLHKMDEPAAQIRERMLCIDSVL